MEEKISRCMRYMVARTTTNHLALYSCFAIDCSEDHHQKPGFHGRSLVSAPSVPATARLLFPPYQPLAPAKHTHIVEPATRLAKMATHNRLDSCRNPHIIRKQSPRTRTTATTIPNRADTPSQQRPLFSNLERRRKNSSRHTEPSTPTRYSSDRSICASP